MYLLVYKALRGGAPRYLSDFVVPVASDPSGRRLRSANSLNIVRPRTRIRFGNRGFSIAASDAWKSLSLEIKMAPSLCMFTEKLKLNFSKNHIHKCSLLIFDR